MSAVYAKRSWVEEMDDPQEDRKATKVAKKGGSRESSNSRHRSRSNKKEGSHGDNKPWESRNAHPKEPSQVGPPKKPVQLETDPLILQRRQKQIDYGKNTVGYHNYVTQVPIDQRTKDHPKTPDKFAKYSRRSWDQLIKRWRINLHEYDSDSNSGEDNIEVIEEDDDSDEKDDDE